MYTKLKKLIKKTDKFLILSFIAGLIPASFIIHVIPTDFSGFYFQAISFLKYHSHAYQIIENYCGNPLNTGVNARAPLVPFLMAMSIGLFDRNLLGIYLPFLLARVLILPLAYLIGRYFLPRRLSFLASVLLLYIPKLQTYSFGTFEADIFVALFYQMAFYFYLRSQNLMNRKYTLISALSLGLGALTKSTGFSIAFGFILSIILINLKRFRNKNIANNFIIYLLYFTIFIGPYILWTYIGHGQIYLTNHHDKSVSYVITNLPSLIRTIPLYLGINFPLGVKAHVVSFSLLTIFIIGIIQSFIKKYYLLTFPTIITIFLISTLSTCLIGGNIPGSLEFITVLGFSMIPSSILLIIGLKTFINFIFKHTLHTRTPFLFLNLFAVMLIVKFTNNYFSSPYSLNYISDQYYISLPTVIKNQAEIPDVDFTMKKGKRIFTGPIVHREIRKQFTNFRFEPFSKFYRNLLLSFTIFSLIIVLFHKPNKKS